MVFWLNGHFQEDTVAIDVGDRGFLLGDGVFETLLVHDGVAAFLDQHLARLRGGLNALQIQAELPDDIGGIIQQLSIRCGLENDTASVRITVTRGASGRGLQFPVPDMSRRTLLMTMSAAPRIANRPDRMITLIISQHCRAEKSITARCKTLNYLDNLLARNDALDAGAEDAVMLNGRGNVACASAANIFLLDEDGHITTPPVAEGALPGIVREILLGAGPQIDRKIDEVVIEASALKNKYVVLSNSLMGVCGARWIEQSQPWPDPAQRSLRLLQTWYDECLRRDLAERAKTLLKVSSP